MGVWMEIVTLLVPGFNDSEHELDRLTSFLAGVSPDIPWHITAFHQNYKMTDPANTTPAMLTRAAAIGRRNGLRFSAQKPAGEVGDPRTPLPRLGRCSGARHLSAMPG
jgi:pyruvate formate lyase activating enzyme